MEELVYRDLRGRGYSLGGTLDAQTMAPWHHSSIVPWPRCGLVDTRSRCPPGDQVAGTDLGHWLLSPDLLWWLLRTYSTVGRTAYDPRPGLRTVSGGNWGDRSRGGAHRWTTVSYTVPQ